MNSALNSMQFPDHDSHEEERLAGNLVALADYRTPPTSVAVEAVIGAGRRRVQRRRGGTALGTAAVVAIAGLGAWGATVATRGHSDAALAEESAGFGSDPMTPQLAFGWLPGPATGGFGWSEDPTRGSTIDVENGTVNLSVTLEHPGAPEPGGPYTDGGTVNGHRAVWASGVAIEPVLAWHYKPDAWAYVLAEGANSADTHKIAETLRIGPQVPIPLPMHVAALPHGFTVGGGSATGHTATKGDTGGGFTLCTQGNCSWNNLTVTANIGFGLKLPGEASTVVAGASAPASGKPVSGGFAPFSPPRGGPVIESFSIDGLQVRAEAFGTAVQAIGGESGLTAFIKSITWYGADPATWTTNVIG